MLIIGQNDTCDRPLKVFLIIFVVRLGCSLPIMLYQHLRPSGYRNRYSDRNLQQQNDHTENSNGTDNRHVDNHHLSVTTNTNYNNNNNNNDNNENSNNSNNNSNNNNNNINNNINNNQLSGSNSTLPSNQPTNLTNGWIDRIKSLLDLISILWFIVGNYLLFTVSDECHVSGKHLFYTILAWILLGYFLILIPLILCATVIFCLPCLLVMMRAMNVDYATGMVGANKNEIQQIPIFKFKTSDNQQQDQPNTSNLASNTNKNTNSTTTSNFIWLRRIFHFPFKKNTSTDLEIDYETFTLDPIDATCTICLSNYENDELICVLQCNHHFHKDCVHEWLALNYKCPLCLCDFRGKRVGEEDVEVEE
ncbi:unnamed protein product [Cunninghamella blakesleeana]